MRKKAITKKVKKTQVTNLHAKTLTIVSLNRLGQQQVTSSYNWGNSSQYNFIIDSEKTMKNELVRELKKFDENLSNWVAKSKAERIAKLTTSKGTYFL